MATCRSCGADIIWARTVPGGKLMPVNVEPSERGNLVLTGDSTIGFDVSVMDRKDDGHEYYLSHYATCPQAGQWRKAG